MKITVIKKAVVNEKPQGYCPIFVDDFPAPKNPPTFISNFRSEFTARAVVIVPPVVPDKKPKKNDKNRGGGAAGGGR